MKRTEKEAKLKTYPALFHGNKNGSYTIIFPDLPGCITEGRGLDDAMCMAQDVLSLWLEVETDLGHRIAPPSALSSVKAGKDEFATLISAEVKEEVRRTLKVPRKLNYMAKQEKLDLSLFLSQALERHFAGKTA